MSQKSYTSIDEHSTPDLQELFSGSGNLAGTVTGGFTWEKEAADPDQAISGGVVTWTRTVGVETHALPVTTQPRIIKTRARINTDAATINILFRATDGYVDDPVTGTAYDLKVTRTDSGPTLDLQFRSNLSGASAAYSSVGTARTVSVTDASNWFEVVIVDTGASVQAWITGKETVANTATVDTTTNAAEPEFGIGANLTGTQFDYVKVWY